MISSTHSHTWNKNGKDILYAATITIITTTTSQVKKEKTQNILYEPDQSNNYD